ncbi:MAG: di-trans,poly-cis-decaprenylcistransferase, partial [Muribaculaceae bacterium]|nr:di-trans,poly-cis-decaprenylcistransferase [Muribaculaceae bacterium]
LQVIGDMSRIPQAPRERLSKCIDATSKGSGLTLILAISYSSRWEITEAVRGIAADVSDGKLVPADITPELLSKHMVTAGYPDPDLLIRTGGDHRVSNFLLWQIAYSEIYVTPCYWPDFTNDDFVAALDDYSRRQRRFGLTGDQIDALKSSHS